MNMRQAVMTSPGVIEFRQVPLPEPGPGEVMVRVQRIGVCGSDVHVNKGLHPFTKYPVVQGHEWSGVVESVGQGVAGIASGMKVTATPQIVCGHCKPCRRGDYNICDTLKVQGFQAPGCAQDFFVAAAEKIVPLPESFTFEQGALVEPTAVAVHCTGRAGDLGGKNVAVIGAGPIGNLAAQLCRARGANVLLADVSDYRLQIAKQCNITHVSNARQETLAQASARAFGDEGFDVAFECAGVQPALDAAVATIQKGGTIVVVAVYEHRPTVDMSVVGDRELKLVGTLMYKREDYVRAVELIGSGAVVAAPLESKHFPFAQYADAYRFIDEQGERSMKVFIDL
jgi:2-desacetyl-2-hydroxyethyl bacteriochlorophyllide A dehydrogenase